MTRGKSVNILERTILIRIINASAFCFFMLIASMNAFSAEHKVGMEGWEFNPSRLTIKVGDTVVWINDDDTRHKISFEDKSLNAPTRENAHKFKAGDKFSFTFKKAGEFKYSCITHEGQDMLGVVVVEDK